MKLVPLFAALLFFVSCDLETEEFEEFEIPEAIDYTEQNELEITTYLTDNDLVAEKSESGLHYIINEQGTGAQPDLNSTVTVAYKGYYLDGTVFEESSDDGLSFGLQQVILGWMEGIAYFNEGGTGVLFVPAHLGYGSYTYSGIPGGSVLIFDINLITVD